MAKITIELDKNNNGVVTYGNDDITYPVCKFNKNSFIISKETNISTISLISEIMIGCGESLECQLIEQGFVNKPLNKPADGK